MAPPLSTITGMSSKVSTKETLLAELGGLARATSQKEAKPRQAMSDVRTMIGDTRNQKGSYCSKEKPYGRKTLLYENVRMIAASFDSLVISRRRQAIVG